VISDQQNKQNTDHQKGRLKMREWKNREQVAGVENAGVENTGV